jgi:type I restriction enzyme S subunit
MPKTASNGWRETTLGELTDNFDGRRVPVREADRRPGTYPYYGASGIVDHVDQYIFDGEYLLIAEDGENLRTCKTPIAFLARGKFWVNNHAHIVRGNDEADTRFLMYALNNGDISGYLTGSTMPKLTGFVQTVEVSTPAGVFTP